MRARRPAVMLAVAIAALLLLAVPAVAGRTITGPTKQYKVNWELAEQPDEQPGMGLKIWLISGFCLGEQRPIAGPPTVVELPVDAEHPRPQTIITARVIAPDPHRTKKEEETRLCEDLGLRIPEWVELKRSVAGTVFLDGSYDPPRRVRFGG